MSKSGVYVIINRINGKIYLGSAVRLVSRWQAHRYLLRRGKHHSAKLQTAWSRYGEESFEFEVLEHCERDVLRSEEQHLMALLRPEYNISGRTDHIEYTQEVRDKIGKASHDRAIIRELCEEQELPLSTVDSRLRRGWDLDRALGTPAERYHASGKKTIYNGKTYTQNELARQCGISSAALCRRLKAGLTVEEAVSMTPDQAEQWRLQRSREARWGT